MYRTAPGLVSDGGKGVEILLLRLLGSIDQIHNHDASSLSFEELYRSAYRVIIEKHGEALYAGVQSRLEFHVKRVGQRMADSHDESYLAALCLEWEDFDKTSRMIGDILMYADKHFAAKNKRAPVRRMALDLFKAHVVCGPHTGPRLIKCILTDIQNDREGLPIDKLTLKNVLRLLKVVSAESPLALYRAFFEVPFLAATRETYMTESRRIIDSQPVSSFLRLAERRYAEERARVEAYLLPETGKPLQDVMALSWVTDHYKTIVHSENGGCRSLLEEDRVDDIRRAYILLSKDPNAIEELRTIFEAHIRTCGDEIIGDPVKCRDPIAFIEALFLLKKRADRFTTESGFGKDKYFLQALKNAMESFINRSTITSQFLSIYLDDFLKKRLRTLSDAGAEAVVEQSVAIFKYINDKDVFEATYRSHLGRRLLGGKPNFHEDAEKMVVATLKAECGHAYTLKMEGMFGDVRNSEELNRLFKLYMSGNQWIVAGAGNPAAVAVPATPVGRPSAMRGGLAAGGGEANHSSAAAATADGGKLGPNPNSSGIPNRTELYVNVLTTTNWPTEKSVSCQLPQPLEALRDAFDRYYLTKHDGRLLKWIYTQGSAIVRGIFRRSRHELVCSTIQMTILMAFNEHPILSMKRIEELSGLPVKELRRHFLSLCIPHKARLLVHHGSSASTSATADTTSSAALKTIGEDDLMQVDLEFTQRTVRVKLPLIASTSRVLNSSPGGGPDGEGGCGNAGPSSLDLSVPPAVDEQRKHLVEAAIVRVMKSRKTLVHGELVTEVFHLLHSRFVPSVSLVKQRIENLISRDYIQRCPDQGNLYKYVS